MILFLFLSFADFLYYIKDYESAVLEYERELRKEPKQEAKDSLRFKLACAYFMMGKRVKSAEIFKTLDMLSAKILYVLAFMDTKDFYQIHEEVKQVIKKDIPPKIKKLMIIKAVEEGCYKEAAQYAEELHMKETVEKIERMKNYKGKSPALAHFLSLIPGLGELYTGRFKEGAMAFSVNSIVFYFFVKAITRKNFVDAGLIYIFLLPRFYLGSMANAYRFAIEKNMEFRNKAIDEVKKEIAYDSIFNKIVLNTCFFPEY